MGDKLAVKAVPVPDAQKAGQRNLRDHGEGLDGKDDRNRAVAGLHHPEGEVLGHMAGDKIGAQEDEDEFRPHFLQGNEKGRIYKGAGGQHGVVKRHDVHHDPRGDGGENNGLKFGFGHRGSSCFCMVECAAVLGILLSCKKNKCPSAVRQWQSDIYCRCSIQDENRPVPGRHRPVTNNTIIAGRRSALKGIWNRKGIFVNTVAEHHPLSCEKCQCPRMCDGHRHGFPAITQATQKGRRGKPEQAQNAPKTTKTPRRHCAFLNQRKRPCSRGALLKRVHENR